MLSELFSKLEDSRKNIGHFKGPDPRRNGTEPMSTNLMEKGRKLAEGMMLNFAESRLHFVPAAPWKEENW